MFTILLSSGRMPSEILDHTGRIRRNDFRSFPLIESIRSLSSNDNAKIRLFSDTTKFQRAIRGDFQQNSIKTNVNKPNS